MYIKHLDLLILDSPRTGSTSLLNLFRPSQRLVFRHYTFKEIQELAKESKFADLAANAKKVVFFSRNPYDRVESFYRFLKGADRTYSNIKEEDAALIDKSLGIEEESKKYNTFDFSEFVKEEILEKNTKFFRPQSEYIEGVEELYFSGKTENLNDDFLALCRKMGTTPCLLGTAVKTGSIPLDWSKNLKSKVAEKYEEDFKRFDYSI